eukprot:2918952-Prymnesium_polylepis.1
MSNSRHLVHPCRIRTNATVKSKNLAYLANCKHAARVVHGDRCEKSAFRVLSSFHGAGRDRPGRAAASEQLFA